MRTNILKLGLIALVAMPTVAAHAQQPAQDYAYPPLSRARHQYYNQHPDEWQRLLESLPRPSGIVPAARPPAPKVGTLASKLSSANPSAAPATGAFTPITNPAPVALGNPIMLTDGTILAVDEKGCNGTWYRYTPDLSSGFNAYLNGTWAPMNPQPTSVQPNWGPRFFSSGVLPDGRVVAIGGEYNAGGACASGSDTSLGAIYDPVSNTWTALSPPSNFSGAIGDAAAIVLPNGTYMETDATTNPGGAALLNPATLTWTATGNGKYDRYDEESLTQILDGRVLTVDAYAQVFTPACGMNSETYDYNTGNWTSAGNTTTQQADCSGVKTYEVGPLLMSPFGSALSFPGLTTGYGNVNVFDPVANSWSTASVMPNVNNVPYTMADAPAAVLPNGNVLVAMSPGNWPNNHAFPTTTNFWEYSGGQDSFTQISGNPATAASSNSYEWNFLVLPSGQIMVFNIDSVDIELYTAASRTYFSSWQPVVTSAPSCVSVGGTFQLSGTQLNGLTEGAYYGDDTQAATNFPLVLLTNSSPQGQYFAPTYNHSSRSIAQNAAGSTSFTVPAMPTGPATLYVFANGINSQGTPVDVKTTCSTVATHDFNGDAVSDILWQNNSNSDLAMWLMHGGEFSSGAGFGPIPNWSVVGTRDFNGDGDADILWMDTSGDLAVWLMNGTSVSSGLSLGNVGTQWQVVGTGDFNGDGTGDILWRDTNGDLAIWLMSNGQYSSGVSLGQVANAWSVAGTGDFNGDGTADILWYNTQTGDVAIWLISNGQFSSGIGLGNVGTQWRIVGTGDFNGDGTADILWRDTSGDYAIWLMSNGRFASGASIAAGVSNVWSVAETGDFNADGKSDILWIDTSGDLGLWEMNGTSVSAQIGLGNVGSTWKVQGKNAD